MYNFQHLLKLDILHSEIKIIPFATRDFSRIFQLADRLKLKLRKTRD